MSDPYQEEAGYKLVHEKGFQVIEPTQQMVINYPTSNVEKFICCFRRTEKDINLALKEINQPNSECNLQVLARNPTCYVCSQKFAQHWSNLAVAKWTNYLQHQSAMYASHSKAEPQTKEEPID